MNIRRTLSIAGAAVIVATGPTLAQQPPAQPQIANPSQSCTLTPAQVADGRKIVFAFFEKLGDELVALADPAYKQHNPAMKKQAEAAKISDFEEFKNSFDSAALAALAARRASSPRAAAGAPAARPTPPGPNNDFEIVLTECDITAIVHKNWRQDPETPGRWFEAFFFQAFRVRNGKLVEHWDASVINHPRVGESAEYDRRLNVLSILSGEYLSTNPKGRVTRMPGVSMPPPDWVNERLGEKRETFRVELVNNGTDFLLRSTSNK